MDRKPSRKDKSTESAVIYSNVIYHQLDSVYELNTHIMYHCFLLIKSFSLKLKFITECFTLEVHFALFDVHIST